MIGKTLAHHDTTSRLGKGRMGEAYQAVNRGLGGMSRPVFCFAFAEVENGYAKQVSSGETPDLILMLIIGFLLGVLDPFAEKWGREEAAEIERIRSSGGDVFDAAPGCASSCIRAMALFALIGGVVSGQWTFLGSFLGGFVIGRVIGGVMSSVSERIKRRRKGRRRRINEY